VIGHSDHTNVVYLAEGVPDDELDRLVVEALDDIVARARLAVARDPHADAERLAEIADTAPDQLVERGVATCVNGAVDPATDQRCNRGILGCFTCPSGYRTDANIPGLKATVALTDAIRARDPDEWFNGPASTLHAYASAALDQFGPDHAAVDIGPVLAVVAALYNEVHGRPPRSTIWYTGPGATPLPRPDRPPRRHPPRQSHDAADHLRGRRLEPGRRPGCEQSSSLRCAL
jgi:hypothetical protein